MNDPFEQLISGDDEQAEAAAMRIGEIGLPALPQLKPLLASNSADARWWAVRALAAIPDTGVEPHLRTALEDPDPAVRQCAALGLVDHPCPACIPELVACLSGRDQLLARLAGSALTVIGGDAVEPLLGVMAGGPQIARLEAVKALAEIADPRAIPVFYKAVTDGDSPLIEYWSEIGLDRLGIGMAFFKPD